jgi:hypothetical protein
MILILDMQTNEVATIKSEHCPISLCCAVEDGVVWDSQPSISCLLRCEHVMVQAAQSYYDVEPEVLVGV